VANAGLGRTVAQPQSAGRASSAPILGADGSSAELLGLPRTTEEGRSIDACQIGAGQSARRLAKRKLDGDHTHIDKPEWRGHAADLQPAGIPAQRIDLGSD
jgi:hypothetical protein